MATDYFLARSLALFRDSINRQFPRRDTGSDGWIGDTAHAGRSSDHNPDWTVPAPRTGVVRAIDVDIDDNDAGRDLRREILNATIGHRAVWYVISNGVIYSRTYHWAARIYTGPNGHFRHVHLSLQHTAAAENDITLILRPPAPERLAVLHPSVLWRQFLLEAGRPTRPLNDYEVAHIAWVRRSVEILLDRKRVRYDKRERFVSIINRFQRAYGVPPFDGIPGPKTCARLAALSGRRVTEERTP
jgi:hypothetical protein